MFENIPSFTKNQKDEIGKGEGDEVVVHGGVEALAARDDDADEEVADEPAEEDDQVEDGDEDEADTLLHPPVAQDCLEVEVLHKNYNRKPCSHKILAWRQNSNWTGSARLEEASQA